MLKKILLFFTNGIDFRVKEIYWKDEDGNHYLLHIRETLLGDIEIVGFGVGDENNNVCLMPKSVELTRESPNILMKIKAFFNILGRRFKFLKRRR